MSDRSPLILALGLFLVIPTLRAQEEWFPYVEAEGRVATDRNVVRGNIFAPVWQSEDGFFFFDIRGLTTNQDANEGNLGFGYRKLVGPDRLVGFFGYYDFRETEFGNQYHQGSLGAEMLSSKWGFRVNGYLPENDIEVVSGLNTAFLSGNNLFVRQGLEAAYWGADIEMERLLWSNTDNGKGGKAPLKVAEFDAEWWASIGYFHFDQSDSRFESISGPRARTELRLWNLPLLGNDSRVMLTGQYDYDDVRGSVGTAGLSVRIPIGRYQSTAAPLSGIRRRMLESVVRDIDIVTNAGAFGDPERAKFARTGELISGTVSVDGNTVDPEGVIEGAGVNSLVLASGAAGTIFPAGTVDMNNGQVILGGGSVIGVVGCDTGAEATFAAPGTRPTFRSGFISYGFEGATNGAIIGVNFGSNISGPQGLLLNDVTNFLLDDVEISTNGVTNPLIGGINSGGDAIDADNSSFVLVNSTISTIGTFADGIDAENSTYVVRNSTIDAGDDGIDSFGGSVYTVLDSTIISEDDTLDIGQNDQARIIRTTLVNNALNNGHSAIDAQGGSHVTILDSTIIANPTSGGDAVSLNGPASFFMKNSTLTVNGGEEAFEVDDVGTFTIEDSTITINDSGQATVGFFFQQTVDSNITFRNTILDNNNTNFGSDGLNILSSGTGTVALNIEDSTFSTIRGPVMDDVTSNDTSNLTVTIRNSTLKGEGQSADAIEEIISNNGSTLNFNILNSTLLSATTDSIEDFESYDTSTMNIVIRNSTITGNTDRDPSSEGNAVDGFTSDWDSNMTVLIENSTLTGNGGSGDAIDDISSNRDSNMTVTLRNSTFQVGATNDSGEGIEDIRAFGDSSMNVTVTDSTIAGNGPSGGAGLSSIRGEGTSGTLRATFTNNVIRGINAEAVEGLGAFDTGTAIVAFRNNTIISLTDEAIESSTRDSGSLSLELTNNTLTSGATSSDISLEQFNTSTLDVVDLPGLSGNNNGATISTSATIGIGNIGALP